MQLFAQTFCPALIGTMLLASGLGHAVSLLRVRDLLREHGLLPPVLLLPAAVALTAFECASGGGAIWFLVTGRWGAFVALTSIALALVFVSYLVMLLRHGPRNTSCGCTPFRTPLTEASFVPAVTLLFAALLLGGALAVGSEASIQGAERALASTAGVVTGALAFLTPATMPTAQG